MIDDAESAVVRGIYDWALGREEKPHGVKAIVSRLNAEGIGFRGKRFHNSNVHRILTSSTYAGIHYFNRRSSRSGELKPKGEWVLSRTLLKDSRLQAK